MIDALKANNGKYTGYNSTKKEAKICTKSFCPFFFVCCLLFIFEFRPGFFNDLILIKKIHLKFQCIYDEQN